MDYRSLRGGCQENIVGGGRRYRDIAGTRYEFAQNNPCADEKRGLAMKRTVWAVLAASVFVILFAGKDDIRRLRRMHAM
jgi:hypothetical protein